MADTKITPEFKDMFVSLLHDIPNITAVCKLVGIDPSNISRARQNDPEFDKRVLEAREFGYDMVEEEARRRAVDGVLEPVFYKGEEIGNIRRYSDQLLSQLLKAYKPKKFNPGVKLGIGEGEKTTLTLILDGDGNGN